MEYIIDSFIRGSQSTSKYRKWTLQLFVCSVLLNMAILLFTIVCINEVNLSNILISHSMLGLITMLVGVLFTYQSIQKKEERTYQYAVSMWGLFMLTIPILAVVIF